LTIGRSRVNRLEPFGLGVMLACAALAPQQALAQPASDPARSVRLLLTAVCLPIIKDSADEATVTRAARLHPSSAVWFPQSRPKDLRQYSGPYPRVSTVNLTSDSCFVHVDAADYPGLEAAVRDALSARREPWSQAPPGDEKAIRHAFCDSTNTVGVIAFEVTVTRRPKVCVVGHAR
jgi:hypothetical protein